MTSTPPGERRRFPRASRRRPSRTRPGDAVLLTTPRDLGARRAWLTLPPQTLERLLRLAAEFARLGVDDAQSADADAVDGERLAGVEADARLAGDQGAVGEPRVERGVVNLHQSRLTNRVGAKGTAARRLCAVDAEMRLEPLALTVDKTDQRDRAVGQCGGSLRQRVEAGFGSRVQHTQFGQQRQSLLFDPSLVHQAVDRGQHLSCNRRFHGNVRVVKSD